MRRGIAIAFALAAACGKKTGTGSAPVIVVPPAIDAAPMTDASTEAVDTAAAPAEWWTQGVAVCPKGGHLVGAAPPAGQNLKCERDDNYDEGPEAWWDTDGKLVSIGINKNGGKQGLFTAFYPDGKKHREGSYRAGNQHGAWTTWWPNGQVFLKEHYVDGRADGEQVAFAQDGKVLEKWSLAMGTGTMRWWNDDGTRAGETEYVDGRAHGASTSYWPNGKVSSKGQYIEGEPDGLDESWDDQGRLTERGTYARGRQIGDWSRYDGGVQTRLQRRDGTGEELFEIIYQDGQPLVPVPGATACDDKDELRRAAYGNAKKSDNECLERIRMFPGLAVTGGFAYDAGCMDMKWIVDCHLGGEPDSKAILARAGWAKARGIAKKELAEAYIDEVALLWSGGTTSEPDPVTTVVAADGGAVVTAWVSPRSGMREDRSITRMQWTFTPDGAVTAKVIGQGTRK